MLNVEGKVRARLLKELQTDTDAPYHGKTLYLTSVSSRVPSTFPTLAMDAEDSDIGGDLEGEQIGISSIVQLKAFSENSLEDASELIDYAGYIMIGMMYRCIERRTLSDVKPYCKVARFQRAVGGGDTWN